MLKPPSIHLTISPIQQLKAHISQTQQKLNTLKNSINPTLLENIRNLQKQIKRIQIINIKCEKNNDNNGSKVRSQVINSILAKKKNKSGMNQPGGDYSASSDAYSECQSYENEKYDKVGNLSNKKQQVKQKLSFLKTSQQKQFVENNNSSNRFTINNKSRISNKAVAQPKANQIELNVVQELSILKNISTRNFRQNSNPKVAPQSTIKKSQPQPAAQQQQNFIQKVTSISEPIIMEGKIYPVLNKYLSQKTQLIGKLVQLNPEKRHNNTLLVPHQRVLLKQHLDNLRRVNKQLSQKNQKLQRQLNKDFVMVKNKWQDTQRQLFKLNQQQTNKPTQ